MATISSGTVDGSANRTLTFNTGLAGGMWEVHATTRKPNKHENALYCF